MKRTELIRILETNLEKHVEEYKEAVINYRKALMVDLTEALRQAQDESFNLKKIKVDFVHPQSHESDYTRVLKMMRLSIDDTIEIDNQAYDAYIEDEWQWKSQFRLMNSTYATKAAVFESSVGGMIE